MRQLGKRRATTLLSVAITATLVCGVTNGFAAAAPEESGVGFSSSFEDGQPQPSWANTVETDAAGNPKSAGVIGSDGTGIPGNVSDKVLEVKANGADPLGELQADRAAPTVADMCRRFIEEHAPKRRPSYEEDAERIVRTFVLPAPASARTDPRARSRSPREPTT